MNTSTHTHTAMFVAKAQFMPQNKWFGKYEKYWFDSRKYSKPDATDKVQFTDLKRFIDANVLPKVSMLTIFDNREFAVNSSGELVNKYASNEKIIFEYINGYVSKDKTLDLGFMDSNISADFLKSMLQSFREPTQADIDFYKLYKKESEKPDYLSNDFYIEAKQYGYAMFSPEKLEQRMF